MGIHSVISYFTAIHHTQQECPPSAWREERYLPGKDIVQSTRGATPLPSLLLETSHQPRALTPASLLPPAPTPHPRAPASLAMESGDHSSCSQPPPSSPRIPSVTFGHCKHQETRLTLEDAVLGLQSPVANSSTAQNQSLAGHDLLLDGAFQTPTSVLKISGSAENIICQK